MPRSKQWAYLRHQAFGDIPSFTFYDDDTLDAFVTRSSWAFAEKDDLLTGNKLIYEFHIVTVLVKKYEYFELVFLRLLS